MSNQCLIQRKSKQRNEIDADNKRKVNNGNKLQNMDVDEALEEKKNKKNWPI